MEDKIKEYIQRGGKSFNITSIATIRDGGTVMINTNLGTYYLNHLTYSLCKEYPTKFENIIEDEPFFWYFLERMKRYREHLEIEAKLIEKIVKHHKN